MVALVGICSMTGSICLMINERISAVRAVNLAPLMSTKINLCYQELLIFFPLLLIYLTLSVLADNYSQG